MSRMQLRAVTYEILSLPVLGRWIGSRISVVLKLNISRNSKGVVGKIVQYQEGI